MEGFMDRKPRVLYVTRLNKGSTSFGYLEGFRNLDLPVRELDTSEWLGNWTLPLQEKIARKLHRGRLSKGAVLGMNKAIVKAAEEFEPDLTFFVGAPFIMADTLLQTKRYGLNFCHFQDDMFNPVCQTYTFFDSLPYWDLVL